MKAVSALLLALLATSFSSATAIPIPDQDWDYVNIRPNANLFWWLYGLQGNTSRDNAPLVMWLQGGPGAASSGYGNFEELGPLDLQLKPRPHTWVNSANVIFVDQPVGTGYSYVTDSSAYVTTEAQIGQDLVNMMRTVVNKYTQFQTSPFYVFCESYGGKMTASFAAALIDAISTNKIKMNFKGIALGDSWIRPMSFVNTWGPYLYSTAEVDYDGMQKIMKAANMTQAAVNAGQWTQATNLWGETENVVEYVSQGVDFYNILDRSGSSARAVSARMRLAHGEGLESLARRKLAKYQSDPLSTLMNGPIRQHLQIIPESVKWGGQSENVFNNLAADFMQDLTPTIDLLLGKGFPVVIYTGNLDLICCSIGTWDWMNTLQWSGYQSWKSSPNKPLYAENVIAGYEKSYSNLQVFTIFGAGHMVPADQPVAAEVMLRKVLGLN